MAEETAATTVAECVKVQKAAVATEVKAKVAEPTTAKETMVTTKPMRTEPMTALTAGGGSHGEGGGGGWR